MAHGQSTHVMVLGFVFHARLVLAYFQRTHLVTLSILLNDWLISPSVHCPSSVVGTCGNFVNFGIICHHSAVFGILLVSLNRTAFFLRMDFGFWIPFFSASSLFTALLCVQQIFCCLCCYCHVVHIRSEMMCFFFHSFHQFCWVVLQF